MKPKIRLTLRMLWVVCCFILLPSLAVAPIVDSSFSLRRVRTVELSSVEEIVQNWQAVEQSTQSYPSQKSDKKFDLLADVLRNYHEGRLTIQSDGLRSGAVPAELRDFLTFLINNAPDVDSLVSLVDKIRGYRDNDEACEYTDRYTNAQEWARGLIHLQHEMLAAQAKSFSYYLSPQGNAQRFQRMQEAYPLSKEFLTLAENNRGIPFMSSYLYELYSRTLTISDENILYLVSLKELKAAVIPFEALRFMRGGSYRVINKDSGDMGLTYMKDGTMRQYVAFHTGRANFYGLAITEAETKPGVAQGAHNHGGFEEETIFLSDKVTITSGTSGNSVIYSFSDMSFAPAGVQHQLINNNPYSSVDFTLKNSIGQLTKARTGQEGNIGIEYARKEKFEWGEIYTQIYRKSGGQIPTAIELDADGFAVFNDQGQLLEKGGMPLQAQIVVVKSGGEAEMPFAPLDGKTQIIRIFPWPRNIPEETTQWLSKDNIGKIKGQVVVHYEGGGTITLDFNGGDVIVLNNAGNKRLDGAKVSGDISGDITGYEIKNTSEDNLELMFLTINPGSGTMHNLSSMGDFEWSAHYEKGDIEDGTYRKGEFSVTKMGDNIEAEFSMSFMEDRDPWAPRFKWEKKETSCRISVTNEETRVAFERTYAPDIEVTMPGRHLLGFTYAKEDLYFVVSNEFYQTILKQIKGSYFYYASQLPVSQFLTVEEARKRGLWG